MNLTDRQKDVLRIVVSRNELSDIFIDPRAKAARSEALYILRSKTEPAERQFDYIKRVLGREQAISFGGEFISEAARLDFKEGKRAATRVLFDRYAGLVFENISAAVDFIGKLHEIKTTVEDDLGSIDNAEAELCALEWERKAWERKSSEQIAPTILGLIQRRLRRQKSDRITPSLAPRTDQATDEAPRPKADLEMLATTASASPHHSPQSTPSTSTAAGTSVQTEAPPISLPEAVEKTRAQRAERAERDVQQDLTIPQLAEAKPNAAGEIPFRGIAEGAMSGIPALQQATKRKLVVLWDTLRDKHNVTEEDVYGYDLGRQWLLGVVAKPPHGMKLGGLNTSDRRRAANWLGLDPSVKAAEVWFRAIDWEYWLHWCSSGAPYESYAAWLDSVKRDVAAEIASMWKGRSIVTDRWFDSTCGPAIEKALSALIKKRIAQAREVEVRNLERRPRHQAQNIPMRSMAASAKFGMTPDAPPGANARSRPRPENWEDIELSFVSDHDVEIRIGDEVQKLNYKEIKGFEDRRTGKPSQLWAMARVFGSLPGGTMPDDARTGDQWIAIQKKIERTSTVLRKHFGMTGDPFPYISGTGYRARVKIKITSAPTD